MPWSREGMIYGIGDIVVSIAELRKLTIWRLWGVMDFPTTKVEDTTIVITEQDNRVGIGVNGNGDGEFEATAALSPDGDFSCPDMGCPGILSQEAQPN